MHGPVAVRRFGVRVRSSSTSSVRGFLSSCVLRPLSFLAHDLALRLPFGQSCVGLLARESPQPPIPRGDRRAHLHLPRAAGARRAPTYTAPRDTESERPGAPGAGRGVHRTRRAVARPRASSVADRFSWGGTAYARRRSSHSKFDWDCDEARGTPCLGEKRRAALRRRSLESARRATRSNPNRLKSVSAAVARVRPAQWAQSST